MTTENSTHTKIEDEEFKEIYKKMQGKIAECSNEAAYFMTREFFNMMDMYFENGRLIKLKRIMFLMNIFLGVIITKAFSELWFTTDIGDDDIDAAFDSFLALNTKITRDQFAGSKAAIIEHRHKNYAKGV